MSILAATRVLDIAVLIETDSTWGRTVVQGIAKYAGKYGPWNLLINPRNYSQRWTLPDRWRGHGIIARISTPLQADEISRSRLPTVDVDDVFTDLPGVGRTHTDEAERARLAFLHFRERGLSEFAYYAPPSSEYSRSRERVFVQTLAESGFGCHVYRPGYRVSRRIDRDEMHNRVLRWLNGLPRPVAILAVDARRARDLAEICNIENIAVPDDIAILAGDTDDLLCELSNPKLSSIMIASHRLGYEAARLLDELIQGKPVPDQPILVPPLGVVSNKSTDALAIEDPLIVRAMRFIQNHALQGIMVDDILREVPVSRRYLELQFKKHFGRLPAEEIRHLKLLRGKELLTHTDDSVDSIATVCGYAGATQFGVAFRKRFGLTPLAFRKQLHQV